MTSCPFSLGQLPRPTPYTGWLDVLPPVADCLRDYQSAQVAKIADVLRFGARRIVAQAPTGPERLTKLPRSWPPRCLQVCRFWSSRARTRLVRQLSERCAAFGIRHGVLAAAAARKPDMSAKVQIASVDTLHRRAIISRCMPLPPAAVVIFVKRTWPPRRLAWGC